ncbi:MAG: hypothetical protein OXH76_18545 [Boseongicola sp.]|nr:hypothetical protein [Boseongicola sp.]
MRCLRVGIGVLEVLKAGGRSGRERALHPVTAERVDAILGRFGHGDGPSFRLIAGAARSLRATVAQATIGDDAPVEAVRDWLRLSSIAVIPRHRCRERRFSPPVPGADAAESAAATCAKGVARCARRLCGRANGHSVNVPRASHHADRLHGAGLEDSVGRILDGVGRRSSGACGAVLVESAFDALSVLTLRRFPRAGSGGSAAVSVGGVATSVPRWLDGWRLRRILLWLERRPRPGRGSGRHPAVAGDG